MPSESRTRDQTAGVRHQKYLVRLAEAARAQLAALTRTGNAAADQIRQAPLLVPADAAGPAWPEARIAESVAGRVKTVLGVRHRGVDQGLEAALHRKPQAHPARAPRGDGAGEARRMALRGRAPPDGHARWTLRLWAAQAGAVARVEARRHATVRQGRNHRG